MPTLVQFTGGESFTVVEDFEQVNQKLDKHDAAVLNRPVGDDRFRVAVYRSGVAYIQEAHEIEGPMVAAR
jgi:hypothetical protein